MTRRNPPARWVLPTIIDPPTSTCWSVPVPDDPFHKAAFLGALATLGSALSWADDPEHKAREVARVWRDIADNLNKCTPGEIITRSYEDENSMPIRVDCDCNVWALCCDGTEKQIYTAQQVKDLIDGSTTPGQPQPAPGGGCQTYHLSTINGSQALVPATVSEGDTVEISNPRGATNDNVSPNWRCPDGKLFFAGACAATYAYDASSLVPAAPLGELVVKIGADWFAGGALITVPSGVTNVQPVVTPNYVPGHVIQGTVQFDVEVCNNEASSWCSETDFELTDGGWTAITRGWVPDGAATWVPGEGWGSVTSEAGPDCSPNGCSEVAIKSFDLAGAHITSVEVWWYTDSDRGSDSWRRVVTNTESNVYGELNNSTGEQDKLITNDETGVNSLWIEIGRNQSPVSDAYRIRKIRVTGLGDNPFGVSNC